MALRDSIEKKESYFVTEIKSLRRILKKTEESFCYCFIDEILRGTNTIERIAASSSVLESLGKTGSCIYVASHDIELTELLRDYTNVHFRETYEGDDIIFDYKLLEGPSDSTNAILLLKVMGFGDDIIEQAQRRVENFLETRSWKKGDIYE
jgi:DNA mismatch repair ATPase MutS